MQSARPAQQFRLFGSAAIALELPLGAYLTLNPHLPG